MIRKATVLVVMILLGCALTVGYCTEKPGKADNMGKTERIVGNHKDAVVCVERIGADDGSTAGFRIEVINPSKDQNLVLTVRDNLSFLFDIRLFDEKGLDISLMLPDIAKDKRGPGKPKTYRHDVVLPQSSHAWFLPIPRQVRVDPAKPTNEANLGPIKQGRYEAEIRVAVGYFMQDKDSTGIPEEPPYQVLRLTLPKVSLQVNPKDADQDIIAMMYAQRAEQ